MTRDFRELARLTRGLASAFAIKYRGMIGFLAGKTHPSKNVSERDVLQGHAREYSPPASVACVSEEIHNLALDSEHEGEAAPSTPRVTTFAANPEWRRR